MLRPLVVAMSLVPSLAAAQTCTPVTFADDFTTGTIEGVAPAEGAACYMLDMTKHEGNLGLAVEGENVAMGYQVGELTDDGMTEVQLFPASAQVRIDVSQAPGATEPAPFRLSIDAIPPN
ncbi:MAG: hypothetical protein AAF390_15080 [Pseudomonadota bacterium]